jgi:hypothetical protein
MYMNPSLKDASSCSLFQILFVSEVLMCSWLPEYGELYLCLSINTLNQWYSTGLHQSYVFKAPKTDQKNLEVYDLLASNAL